MIATETKAETRAKAPKKGQPKKHAPEKPSARKTGLKKVRVLVQFIQDRSGSMRDVWDETMSGYRKFVEELREGCDKDNVEYLFSLTVFDTLVETPIVARPVKAVDLNALRPHGPRGMTALYDAVGMTIEKTDEAKAGADKVIVVIVTDGHENSSREWSKEKLHTAVEAKLNAGNWTFTYLGTQPETWNDAAAFGVQAGSTVAYDPGQAQAAYAVTGQAVRTMSMSSERGSRTMMRSFMPMGAAAKAGIRMNPPAATTAKAPTTAKTLAASRPRPMATPRTPHKQNSVPATGRWR